MGKIPSKQEDFERFSKLFREENVVAIDECGFQTQHVPLKGYTKKELDCISNVRRQYPGNG